MLPEMGSKLHMAIWVSGISEHFLIHMCRAVHVIKQMSLLMKFMDKSKA